MQRLNLGSLPQERATPWVRQLLGVGAIIRWIGLGVAGIIGVLAPPRAPSLLVALILAVGVYNAAFMWLAGRVSDQSVLRIALAITVLDEIGCLVFLAIFTGLPGGTQIAFYVPMVVEAIAYGGVVGAGQAVVLFAVGIVAVEWAQRVFFNGSFSWAVALLWILVMLVISVSIATLDRSVQAVLFSGANQVPSEGSALSAAAVPNLQLSRREQEVLDLIAAGFSDAMIAARLHLSETTVKTHVGTLRTRLGARTRAEAVAIASRLNLLDREAAPPQA
jgi:DNA-binding CsgD family transcriptional regulator